jgi:Flp pilus assembly protein CpaB
MRRSTSLQRFSRDFARAVSWHRRKLAVLAAVAAVLTGISAANPPRPPLIQVVRAAHRLDGGSVLSEADIGLARLPREGLPDDALTAVSDLVGHTLTGAVSKGQVLTATDLLGPGLATRAGMVLAPLRLADSGVAGLLVTGQRVDIVAADSQSGKASVVATDVLVAALPKSGSDRGLAGSGTETGALVLVEVDRVAATRLAQAGATMSLSVLMH